MSDLKQFTDAELDAEVQRRRKEAELAKKKKQEAHADAVEKILTREMIDVFRPTHDRTSCSDDKPVNGFDEGPRCTRCALLDLIDGQYGCRVRLPSETYLTFELSRG